jgi:hypothetical protein
LEEEKKLVQEFLGRLSAGTILKMSWLMYFVAPRALFC